MAWSTPKTDWDTDDGIQDSDLNRIEENTDDLNTRLAALDTDVDNLLGNVEIDGTNNTDIRAAENTGYGIEVQGSDWDTGSTPTANAGDAKIRGGDVDEDDVSYNGGGVDVYGGQASSPETANNTSDGGSVNIWAGSAGKAGGSYTSGNGGDVLIQGGNDNGSAASSGTVTIIAGAVSSRTLNNAVCGDVRIQGGNIYSSGDTVSGLAGDVIIRPGADGSSNASIADGRIILELDAGNTSDTDLKVLIKNLPSSDPGVADQLYTQTATELGSSGSERIICVSDG